MNKKTTLFSFLLFAGAAYNQTCNRTVLDDDFSTPANWTVVSPSGHMNLINGAAYLDGAHGEVYNKAYQSLSSPVSDTYFKLESDFNIFQFNADGSGPGAVVAALTAGTLDALTYDNTGSYAETNQDALILLITSDVATSGVAPADWYFIFEPKNGSTRTFDANHKLYINPSITHYYITMERTSATTVEVSVFTDAARTTHLSGSPVTETIASDIQNLSVIQHGSSTPGFSTRTMNAIFDNDVVCDNLSSSAAIDELQAAQILLSPNPASQSVHVTASETFTSYALYSAAGNQCQAGTLTTGMEIPVSGLESGVYFLKLETVNGIQATERIVVNRD